MESVMLKAYPVSAAAFPTQNPTVTTAGGYQDWIAQGEAAFAGGDLPGARTCFEKALQRDPLNARALNNLSVVHWTLGDVETALHYLTQALEWDPNDQDIILNCARVFQELDRGEDAEEILRAYLDRKPHAVEVRLQLERLAASTQEPPRSNPSTGTTALTDVAGFFTEHGEQQYAQGRMDHARACFEMALEHDPRCAKAHSNLGVLWWQQGDLDRALEHLHQAFRLDPQDLDILFNSSKALAAAEQFDVAADLLQLYLQQNPGDAPAWKDYDALRARLVVSDWTPLGLSAGVAAIYLQMGSALAQANDHPGAAEAFRRALQLDGRQGESYYRLGLLHRERGLPDEALESLQEALRCDPTHKEAVILMGELLTSRQDTERAQTLYEQYLSQGGENDETIQAALARLSHG
jgi:tetratricopeptide (TPR) repeat protein